MKLNICSLSDSYKFGHYAQYPKGTTEVNSYLESRDGATFPKTVFFGLQYFLKEFLVGNVVTESKISVAKDRINRHLFPNAFNEAGWRKILTSWAGKLPVSIYAVKEGSVVGTNNVLMVVKNNDEDCYWLTNYLETLLSNIWAPSTVATLSYHIKKDMEGFLKRTSDNPAAINFMLHDFGARSVGGPETAAVEGAGHLINFLGTDTFPAVDLIMDYYNTNEMPAFSVPATEHSIMTSQGRDGEMDLMGQLLDKYPTGILSVVIDSYNYREFIEQTFGRYKEKVLSRDGKLVFRPDSGQPNEVTLDCYERVKKHAGFSKNSKGFEVLNPKTGLLWGDGIDSHGIHGLLTMLEYRNISAENMVLGMGGGLLQKINRDTQRFAFKSSYQKRNGVGYDIFKDPIDGSKRSKRGKLALVKTDEGYKTIPLEALGAEENQLELVFKNGELVRDMTFEEIRANSRR